MMKAVICNSKHAPIAFAQVLQEAVCPSKQKIVCPLCAAQEQLDEALMKIEIHENTINDLNLRIAFLES